MINPLRTKFGLEETVADQILSRRKLDFSPQTTSDLNDNILLDQGHNCQTQMIPKYLQICKIQKKKTE